MISYDSVAKLKSFADRKHISYLLFSDPDSKIIRTFGILNETVSAYSMAYGIPYGKPFSQALRSRRLKSWNPERFSQSTRRSNRRRFKLRHLPPGEWAKHPASYQQFKACYNREPEAWEWEFWPHDEA